MMPQTQILSGELARLDKGYVDAILASNGVERDEQAGRLKALRQDVIPLLKGEQ